MCFSIVVVVVVVIVVFRMGLGGIGHLAAELIQLINNTIEYSMVVGCGFVDGMCVFGANAIRRLHKLFSILL